MTPGLGGLRNGATLKCVLLRLPVQSAESRGFKMESEFFPRSHTSLHGCVCIFETKLLNSEVLWQRRGGAGLGPVGRQ